MFHLESLITVFGLQIALKDVIWENILYKIINKHEQYYIFNKSQVAELLEMKEDDFKNNMFSAKIAHNFVLLSNSEALIKIVKKVPEEFRTPGHLIYKTNRPFLQINDFSVDRVISQLSKFVGINIKYYSSKYLSGSWEEQDNVVIEIPYSVEFRSGKTIYEYDEDEFQHIKDFFGSKADGPEKIPVILADQDTRLTFNIDSSDKALKIKFSSQIVHQ